MNVTRKQIAALIELAEFYPVIGVLGPRQVGKTTMIKQFISTLKKPSIYLDLEKPSDAQKLQEAELFFKANENQCIILDKVQIMPTLFPIIRALVDENRIPLRFIVLGSASPDIIRGSFESLAERIGYIDLKPFSYSELNSIPEISVQQHQFRGGFPNSILSTSEKQSLRWLDDFIKTYLERDLPLLGLSASPLLVRRLWEMLAWQNGNLLNNSAIGKSLGLTNHTINSYINYLEGAFMVIRLQPFSVNVKKRIVKSPKIYISDTGVLHRLLRIQSFDQLLGMPMLGASFEAYVLQQITAEKDEDLAVYFYRTHAGTEVDIVLTRGITPVACIEVKYTGTPKITKSLRNGIEDLHTEQNFIITPSGDKYPAAKNITACSIATFLLEFLPALSQKNQTP
tara:strand:+ start:6644 stop:7837 length:1194 start_codon:yes stop_codon:yes gene_type:complete